MARLWKRFLAWMRWSDDAVCEMSIGLDYDNDYHDYPDDDLGPAHFVMLRCQRCGKEFCI